MTKGAKNISNNQTSVFNKAVSFHKAGDLKNAVHFFKQVLRDGPDNAEAHHYLGIAYSQLGNNDLGIKLINKAIRINPDNSTYYANLANIHRESTNFKDSILAYKEALKIDRNNIYAHNGLGSLLYEQGRTHAAIASFRNVIKINPKHVETLNNLGLAFHKLKEFDKAIKYFKLALKNDPYYIQSHINLATTYDLTGKRAEYIQSLERAYEINPNEKKAIEKLCRGYQVVCDWEKLKMFTTKLNQITNRDLASGVRTEEPPLDNISRKINPEENYKIACSWSKDIMKRALAISSSFKFDKRNLNKNKLRLGYLSCDFHGHATAHLMRSLFGLHDRNRFEVFLYSYGIDDHSEYRKKLVNDADQFVDLMEYDNLESAKKIYFDNVDILIELKGYTKNSRLDICAFRPAPIQVTYLGFPGTTGADFIDYNIVDKIVVMETQIPFYKEKIVYMPHCYQVNDHTQVISGKVFEKADFSLPDNSFVFCSFNQMYKIDTIMFDTWMNILRKIQGSVLWLLRGDKTAVRNLKCEAEKRNVGSDRLIFADKLPKDEHLSRLKLADLMLDTRIVNGHTTDSDALWAGVPIITLEGGHFASRVGSSILNAIGLPELVTKDIGEYERLAIDLAGSPEKFEYVREKLKNNRLSSALFDTPVFTRDLESAYERMWSLYCQGKKSEKIEL